MKYLLIITAILFSLNLFAADPVAWKLEGPADSKVDFKDWSWVGPKGEKVPAFTADFAQKIVRAPEAKISTNQQVATFTFPRRGLDGAEGSDSAVVLAEVGKSAKATTSLSYDTGKEVMKLVPLPSGVHPHAKGFFFTSVAGSKFYLFTYLTGPNPKVVLVNEAPLEQIREKLLEVIYKEDSVSVKSALRTLVFDKDATPLDAAVAFLEPTGDNLSLLSNTYKAVDLTKEAESRRFSPPKYTEPQLKNLMRLLNQKAQSSVILTEKNYGVESQSLVEKLAIHLANPDTELRGQKGWRVIEVPWRSLNTEGQVELTVEKVTKLVDTIRQKRIVLFIPDLDQLQGLGVDRNTSGNNDASSVMTREIAQGKILVLGQTNTKGYQKLQTSAKAFTDAFSQMKIDPPTGEDLFGVIKEYAALKGKGGSVEFDDAAIKAIINRTNQFLLDGDISQPRKSKVVIDALVSSPASYGLKEKQVDSASKVDDVHVLNYLAERTGIGTLSAVNPDSGIRKLLKKEVFFKEMDAEIVGHRLAKEAVWNNLSLIADPTPAQNDSTGVEMGVRSIFFLGPSGTGKSHFPEVVSKVLEKYGVKWTPIKFEMSKWSSEAFATTQTGSPPSYVGFEKNGGEFISKLRKSPQTIFVFEEFDKAHRKAVNPLYDLLEFGRFQDANLNEVSISRSLIFITSNFGAQGSQKTTITGDGGKVTIDEGDANDLVDQYDGWKHAGIEPRRAEIKKWSDDDLKDALIQSLVDNGKISPQVIGRVNKSNVIVLHHFTKEEVKELIAMRQKRVEKKILDSSKEKVTAVKFTPEANEFIFQRAWGKNGRTSFDLGARAVLDVVDKEAYLALSRLRDANVEKTGHLSVAVQEVENKKGLKYEFVEKK